MTPTTKPTRYAISCIPEDHELAYEMTIAVEYRGRDLWAVMKRSRCLSADGAWDYEPNPSSRDDDWLATHRFDLDTALRLAQEAAPKLSVGKWTVDRILAELAAESEAP